MSGFYTKTKKSNFRLFKVGFCTKVDFGIDKILRKSRIFIIKNLEFKMRYLLLSFCVVSLNCMAQGNEFNKVIITYIKGHNSWGDSGVYSSGEKFEFIHTKSGYYKITNYMKIEFSAGKDGKTYSKDTVKIALPRDKLKKKIFDSLYIQLNVSKFNFTSEFIRPLLKEPDTSNIIAISKSVDKYYKLGDDDLEEVNKNSNLIKHFDKLDSFITSIRPNPDMMSATIDAWDSARLLFIKNKDTITFQMDFLQPLGQPVLKLRINRAFIGMQFVNLDVNLLIESILPVSSLLRKHVGINALTDDYIKWYIEKVL